MGTVTLRVGVERYRCDLPSDREKKATVCEENKWILTAKADWTEVWLG